MNDSKEISAISEPSQSHVTNGGHEMSRFLPQKAHSARNNDAFTHCGISLISPNTLQQKYSGSLKGFMF